MEKLILKCDKINKYFGSKHILKDVSFEIYEGDILAFIGPNGSGKTTTIKLMLGLQNISSGTVEINGYDIENHFEKAIDKVGAIVENPDLYMYLTGYKNLELVRNLYPHIPKSRIDEVVKEVGLTNRIHDKVSRYSLGMRQRLGIAQALLHEPNLLVLDEPTNGLDPEGIKELRELIQKLAQEKGMAVFISSHNLAELESFCNRACIIQSGKIIETNTIKEMKKKRKNALSVYKLEISDTKRIEKLIQVELKIINDNIFKITVAKEEIPKIVKILVENSIDIFSVREEELSLEEAFLNKTGGNIID